MNKYIVYMHRLPNNKVYIGITSKSAEKRWGGGTQYRHNLYFLNAIKKYGWENIKHEILLTNLTKEEAELNEIELIKQYKSNNKKYGYNLASGGNSSSGVKWSNESKEKLSKSRTGMKFTKEHIENMRKVKLGKKIKPETLEKLKGRTPWNKGKNGLQHHTKESLEKLRIASTGRKHSEEYKEYYKLNSVRNIKINVYDLNGNFINQYISMSEASRKLGVSVKYISACCNKKRNSTKFIIEKVLS